MSPIHEAQVNARYLKEFDALWKENESLKQRLEALERVAQAVRDWQAVDDLVLELEMYALERTKHELLIIEALKALDNYTSSGIESGETK